MSTTSRRIRIAITTAALALAVAHVAYPDDFLDRKTFILLGVAAFPWLPFLLEDVKLPGGWKVSFQEIEERQQKQEREINLVKFLISHFVSADELDYLRKLKAGESFRYDRDDASSFLLAELRRLRAMGLIAGRDGKGIDTLEQEGGDVTDHLRITDQGVEYLALRDEMDKAAAGAG